MVDFVSASVNIKARTPRARSLIKSIMEGYFLLLVNLVGCCMYLIGSFFFLRPELNVAGVWLFVVGSVCFTFQSMIVLGLRVLEGVESKSGAEGRRKV